MTDHAELIERLRGVMAGWRIGDETEAALDAAVAEIAAVFATLHRNNADLRAEVERLREVEVLPLAWKRVLATCHRASGAGLKYEVTKKMETGQWVWWRSNTLLRFSSPFRDIDGAKAAAQADYDRRIRAALGHTQGGR